MASARIQSMLTRIKRDRITLRRDFEVAMDQLEDVSAELEDLSSELEKVIDEDNWTSASEEALVEAEYDKLTDFLERVDDIRNTMKAELSWIKKA